MLGCNQSTIDRHLHDIGKVNQLETWLRYQLTSDKISLYGNFYYQNVIDIDFVNKLLLVMKNESCMSSIDSSINESILKICSEPEVMNDLHGTKSDAVNLLGLSTGKFYLVIR